MQINNKYYSIQELQKIADICFDRSSFAQALGWTYYNGKLSKILDNIIDKTNISVAHFDATKKQKEKRKYQIIEKKCPICSQEFETQQGHPKEKITCSYKCANTYFSASKHTDEANRKRSEKLITLVGPRIKKGTKTYFIYNEQCLFCNAFFQSTKRAQRFCCQSCVAQYSSSNNEYIAKLKLAAKKRVSNGTHKGWAFRSKLSPSFSEKVSLEILQEINFSLERELKVGKWFIDFADVARKIAIEIDGKQHEYPERKAKDMIKDAYLISQGWVVHRIKWQKLTKEFREEVKQKLINILC